MRIVKRESERRQRDRDRSGNIGIPVFGSTGKRVALIEDQAENSVTILDVSCFISNILFSHFTLFLHCFIILFIAQRSQQLGMGQLLESEEVAPSSAAPLTSHSGYSEGITSNLTTVSASFDSSESPALTTSAAMSSSLTGTSTTTATSSWAQESTSSQALDEAMAQLDDELEMTEEAVFQRSLSLPRGFGKTNAQGMEVEASPSIDKYNLRTKKPMVASAPGSESNLSMAGMRRQRVRVSITTS